MHAELCLRKSIYAVSDAWLVLLLPKASRKAFGLVTQS